MRKLLMLCMICFVSICTSAKWVDGVIETNEGTIIKGVLKLPKTDFYTGAWYVNDFDLTYLHHAVKFKSAMYGKKIYLPKQLKSFSFKFNGIDYHFISQTLHYKSIVKSERQKDYFLNIVYSGALMLCKMEFQLDEERHNTRVVLYPEYYLYDAELGVTKLQVNKEYKRIKDILLKYGVAKQFLQSIDGDVSIREVKELLFEYDLWLNEQPDNFQVII